MRSVVAAIRRSRTGLQEENQWWAPSSLRTLRRGENEAAAAAWRRPCSAVKMPCSGWTCPSIWRPRASPRLIGSPPGYVGYEEGGRLTEEIRKRPYRVVLFDELEKAHQDVWNLLLQILEDGTLTDSHGHKADFRNAVLIMTTNAGGPRPWPPPGPWAFLPAGQQNTDRARHQAPAPGIPVPEFLNRWMRSSVFSL